MLVQSVTDFAIYTLDPIEGDELERGGARFKGYEADAWGVRKDGTRFWTNVVIDPITTPDGRLIGFSKITRDLTERKQAQDELDRTREAGALRS